MNQQGMTAELTMKMRKLIYVELAKVLSRKTKMAATFNREPGGGKKLKKLKKLKYSEILW